MSEQTLPTADSPPPKSRWAWWLLGILILGCAGGAIGVWALALYNKRLALDSEKLEAAQAKWKAADVQDYDIDVKVTGSTSGQYHVEVRGGQVLWGTENGIVFMDRARAYPWTIEGLFQILGEDVKRDAKPDSPRAFTRVEFDPSDGHLINYTRNSGTQNIVIEVTLNRIQNDGRQLTLDGLKSAREKWDAAKIEDYDLKATVSGSDKGTYDVKVRAGAVAEAKFEGRDNPQAKDWSVPGIFKLLQQDAERDAKPGSPKAYTRIEFDSKDGHPIRYARTNGEQNIVIEIAITR